MLQQKSAPVPAGLRKILVVDDNPIIQRAVYFALRDKGFLVLMCGNVLVIRQQKPDLILLDLNFPAAGDFGGAAWDGFAAIEWLQRTGDSKAIPIIVISGSDPEVSQPRALAAGAVAYFQKPFDKEKMLAGILAALDKNMANRSDQPVFRPAGGGLATT
jgi:CheY-like chemotaxis protein